MKGSDSISVRAMIKEHVSAIFFLSFDKMRSAMLPAVSAHPFTLYGISDME